MDANVLKKYIIQKFLRLFYLIYKNVLHLVHFKTYLSDFDFKINIVDL